MTSCYRLDEAGLRVCAKQQRRATELLRAFAERERERRGCAPRVELRQCTCRQIEPKQIEMAGEHATYRDLVLGSRRGALRLRLQVQVSRRAPVEYLGRQTTKVV